MQSTVSAFKNCSAVHDVPFDSLRHKDLQSLIDNCNKKHSSLELIVSLLHQMYKYALAYEIVDRDYSSAVKINIADDDEYGVPFTDQELHALRTAKDNETSEMILIMCYSGYRVSAYKSLFVNLEEGYFQGGVKTRASKERIVPIPPPAFFLSWRIGSAASESCFRNREKYGVSENDRKRMLGHSFCGDITNSVYGHRSLSDLQLFF